jgi:hypothetical protein
MPRAEYYALGAGGYGIDFVLFGQIDNGKSMPTIAVRSNSHSENVNLA